MIRILFICHGNICRSPAAEMVFRQLAEERGVPCEVDSAATTYEEIGNDLYPPMRKALARRGIAIIPHAARRTTPDDYAHYQWIVAMDQENLRDLRRIYGGDPQGKISLLMYWAGEGREVADPWYTRDFDAALNDIEAGCRAMLNEVIRGQL